MASVPPSSVSTFRSDAAELKIPATKEILSVIESLKKKVEEDRGVSVQKRMELNRLNLGGATNQLFTLSKERMSNHLLMNNTNLLTKRQMDVHVGVDAANADKIVHVYSEDAHVTAPSLVGSSGATKNLVRPIKLPEVKKLPPYTTWIFLDRNQRMTEDQSVVGRRRIYYDQNGGEALICSDSEEEMPEDDEEKREFVESEDYIIRMTVKEVGVHETVVESLAQSLCRPLSDVKARIEVTCKDEVVGKPKSMENGVQIDNSFYDKDLDAALDSFDNLFCRRCLVFDCRLHGCSQDLIFPVEKQSLWFQADCETVSCGSQCYKLVLDALRNTKKNSQELDDAEENSRHQSDGDGGPKSCRRKSSALSARKKAKSFRSESASSNAKYISESSDSQIGHMDNASINQISSSNIRIPKKSGNRHRNSKRVAERVISCMRKRQRKKVASDSDSVASAGILPCDVKVRSASRKDNEDISCSKKLVIYDSRSLLHGEKSGQPSSSDDSLNKVQRIDEKTLKKEINDGKLWKSLEKSLLDKGIDIFGANSCLIARNLLNGLKTCWEVYQYLTCSTNGILSLNGDNGVSHDGFSKYELNGTVGNEVRRRSKFLRRRGRVRRLKYSWKSTAYNSIRKRISERKDQPCRQYNPCSCQTACGKQCSCHLNGTCCEKYCGCVKTCKNRFRGCHCAKSQCRSRQCPCFAADRECDPDVCRNCWVSCGDGSLGFPGQRGDNYECRNMKLLLKQQQRVLLGRSDVSGWGAFLKNSVAKHEYLGEYTGELISHREADKRGKIYDRENSSFLFNLNDQFVLDAYRKGDKLKFANHSPDPNCYAKVIMVAGDHRVGIFAKERINAGEELFYDYRYEPDRAPAWARKPEASVSKKEDAIHSGGRAKKLA